MPDEHIETPEVEQEDFDLTDQQLDDFAFQRLATSGKLTDYLEKAGITTKAPERSNAERIDGTDLEKPSDYDDWSPDRQNAHIAKHYAKRAEESTNKRVEEAENRLFGLVSPVLKKEGIGTAKELCTPDAKAHVEQAIKDIEGRFGKKITVINEQDAWLIAQRAEALASQEKRKLQTVEGEDNYVGEKNPRVVTFMTDYNKRMKDKPINYETALKWAQEDEIV